MNSKLNKKKVAFVGVLFFLIIILVVILIINLNKPYSKRTCKKKNQLLKRKKKRRKKTQKSILPFLLLEIVPLETMLDKLMMGRLIKNIKSKEKIQLIF